MPLVELAHSTGTDAKMWYSKGVEGRPDTFNTLNQPNTMTNEFNRDLMISMLRKGQDGNQILTILNAITPDTDVVEDVIVEDADVVEDVIVEDAELVAV